MAVVVRLADTPDGAPGVLIQWDSHWIVLTPGEAQNLAGLIYDMAERAERDRPTW